MKNSLISVMLDAGIAHYGGGRNPYAVIRAAKNSAPNSSAFKRELETILKQQMAYLETAFNYLIK